MLHYNHKLAMRGWNKQMYMQRNTGERNKVEMLKKEMTGAHNILLNSNLQVKLNFNKLK